MNSIKRPIAVTIPVILSVIAGIFNLLGGLLMIIIGGFFSLTPTSSGAQLGDLGVLSAEGNWALSLLGIYATFLGFVLLLFGFLYLLTAYGLWQMNSEYRWAWWLTLILSLLGLFAFPIGTILSIIILVCLWTIKDKYGVKIAI